MITFHCCEKSAEVSKQVLDLHFTLRTLFTAFFKDRCFDKKAEFCLETILFAPFPTFTVNGYRAIYARLLDADPRNFNFTDTVRSFMMIFDLWQYEEGTWPGFVLMIDMDKTVLAHVLKLDVMSIRQVLYFLQECMLVKLKEVHFLNAPYFMDKLMMLLKPFMKKALLDIIHVHQTGTEDIYNYVPKKAFPKENGGEYKDYNSVRDDVVKRLRANPDFFRDENRRRVCENKRPNGKNTTVEELFGIQGSFKKLDID
ncbi:alpha-tocopherol transfer protein-like [Hyposmocoma kahamanoa]|uniref:alpha-tocopherol transfer protein-like n=1 Tax=Hyposmocoma kahamanoa TaxID=1477025 RepID=UPI000E6D9012|nr:alpha-tocopherol transfer protein-like [Hyposmocoma kahamanoa]